jgi:hypothetical protein
VVESSEESKSESTLENDESASKTKGHGMDGVIDFNQYSYEANSQFKLHKKKTKGKVSEFQDVVDYFHPPVYVEADVSMD